LVDSIAAEHIEAGHIAGMAVGVTHGEDTVLLKAYGHADLEWDVPMPVDAIFEIGSVTKQFTAVAALMLWEQGELDLDADLSAYLPEYDTQGNAVPLRRLFDHTSGIQGYTEMPTFQRLALQPFPRDTLVHLVERQPFQFAPGEALIYNNSAYFLLGLIIEKVAGQSYEQFLEEHVFPRAGMDDTSYCTNDEIWERRAHGYAYEGEALVRAAYLDHTWPYAAGSLCSTVPDLLAWLEALHAGEVLGAEAYALLVTPEPLNDGTVLRYAKGMDSYRSRLGGRVIGHGGAIAGFLSETRYYPDDDANVVVLMNTRGPPGAGRVANTIAEHLVGDHGPEAAAYPGDLSALVGTYRGPVRGGDSEARVTVREGKLVLQLMGPPQPLEYLGGSTFFRGDARYTFRMDGDVPTGLDLDMVGDFWRFGVDELGEPEVVTVAPEVMAGHAGEYSLAELGVNAAIAFEEGRLFAQIPGQPRLPLVPDSDMEYRLAGPPAYFTFIVEDGETVAVEVKLGPTTIRAERVGG
jgi:CubicO group peptidase (beta-lactamase class C family)